MVIAQNRCGIGRRRFVVGVAAGSVAGLVLTRGGARAAAPHPQQVLSGNRFDLVIGPAPVNITGRRATATLVNGSLPAPVQHWREGDTITLNVTNRLPVTSSIHWHGIRVPPGMDGVPGLSFAGIAPGETFVYHFKLHEKQSGTYWYHSHSAFQEQTGLYGPIVIEPRAGYPEPFERDYVVMLSDWSDTNPETIVSNLKFQSDYYNFHQRTIGTFFANVSRQGLGPTIQDRLMWGRMRMSPTDILDVSGATYTYLLNGQPPAANWTALFRPGERVRLRFINGSTMSIFDVRIPGLTMHVVSADGNEVEPVPVDEFRISVAETYDVIVTPGDRAYTIFAQAEDRTGYASGTLAPRAGMSAPIPPMDPRPLRTMVDMGMDHMGMGSMGGMSHGSISGMQMDGSQMGGAQAGGMSGMAHGSMPGMQMSGMQSGAMGMAHGAMAGMQRGAGVTRTGNKLTRGVEVDNVAMMPTERISEPGEGLNRTGRRALAYTDLRARMRGADPRPPSRDITLHLTGNMERFIWGFDGKKFSEAGPIRLRLGERVRFVLINDTMMEHPIHLHGLWSEFENGHGAYRPYKHTINVKPGGRLSYLVTADTAGRWAYHCHLLYHMEAGMFRTVEVA